MDDFDLDSFIANVEATAPEDTSAANLTCNECGGILEENDDGNFVCPLCSVQATHILQLDDTELHHDELGRPIYGQRVRLGERKGKHTVEYGWSWSTDEAILNILKFQVEAMEAAQLIPDRFITAVYNMFEKFWLQSVCPHIKDDYEEGELVPISVCKALKLRDVEVLVKVKDKVMIPYHLLKGKKDMKMMHRMFGTEFYMSKRSGAQSDSESDSEDDDDQRELIEDDDNISCASSVVTMDCGPSEPGVGNGPEQEEVEGEEEEEEPLQAVGRGVPVDDLKVVAEHSKGQTKTLSEESIEVLTLNRTLAFIEATARCLISDDPLFASDIIRACNQRLLPFYGSSRLLPNYMKFDRRDQLGFQKTKPPTPTQLTRAALLLVANIYKAKLPMVFPVPNMDTILARFTRDMNLPRALFEAIQGKVTFHDFRATRPLRLTGTGRHRLPQYDRWAFAVLLIHLKIMFNLSDAQLIAQKNKAIVVSGDDSAGNFFIFHDWIQQMSMRLELIMRHDPFVLYHPMNEIERMVPTSQLALYLEQIIEDRNHAEITLQASGEYYDDEARKELADLLRREFPPPPEIACELPAADEQLRISKVVKQPIRDAFRRTQEFWSHKLDSSERELVFKSFTDKELILVSNLPAWSIYDCGLTLKTKELEISDEWPEAFQLLLHVGAFMCFCHPVELLEEVKVVEESYHPQVRVIKRQNNARNRQELSGTLNSTNTPRTYGNRARANRPADNG